MERASRQRRREVLRPLLRQRHPWSTRRRWYRRSLRRPLRSDRLRPEAAAHALAKCRCGPPRRNSNFRSSARPSASAFAVARPIQPAVASAPIAAGHLSTAQSPAPRLRRLRRGLRRFRRHPRHRQRQSRLLPPPRLPRHSPARVVAARILRRCHSANFVAHAWSEGRKSHGPRLALPSRRAAPALSRRLQRLSRSSTRAWW